LNQFRPFGINGLLYIGFVTTRDSRITKDTGARSGPRPLRLFHFSGARGSIVPALCIERDFYSGIEFVWVMEMD
jgi:hypothetical protein